MQTISIKKRNDFLDKKKYKISYVNCPIEPWRTEFHLTWMCIKTFYEDFGKYVDNFEWKYPLIKWDEYDYSKVIDELKDSDIIFFSNYVWNYKRHIEIAKRLKENYPNIILVAGGPQVEDNVFFQYTCDATKPGEIFVKYFLDNFIEKKDLDNIPFSINSNYKDSYVFGHDNVYERNIDFLKYCVDYYKKKPNFFDFIIIAYETTRGCPFQCTYCEWGGGVGSKVLKKELNIIESEFSTLNKIGVKILDFCDANFGMFKERDSKVIDLMEKYEIIVGDSFSILKTINLDDKKKLIDSLVEKNIIRQVSISLQTISETGLKVIKRKDLSFDDSIELANHVRTKWKNKNNVVNLKEGVVDIELILGIPGSTKEDFYQEFLIYENLDYWDGLRFPFIILPKTMANDASYKEKYKIKTSKVCYNTTKNESEILKKYSDIYENMVIEFETVIECFSYSFDDFIEMYTMNKIGRILRKNLYQDINYITNIDVVTFFKKSYEVINCLPNYDFYKKQIIEKFKGGKNNNLDTLFDQEGNLVPFTKEMKMFLDKNKSLIYYHYIK